MAGNDVDLHAVMGGGRSANGVAHGDLLVDFAEAAFANDQGKNCELEAARDKLEQAAGPDVLVDAAAVVGNFQRMVRIADGTGIPIDQRMNALTASMREDLGIDKFGSAANTAEVSGAAKTVGRIAQTAVIGALRLASRLRK